MAQYKITTTGTQSPVIFHDLGRRQFTHPTVDYDLLANNEFSLDEITNSLDIKNALSNGYITAKDENNESIISTTESQHIHINKLDLDNIDSTHNIRIDNPHVVTKDQVLSENLIDNNDIDGSAAINESKLNLDFSTHSNAQDHARSHGLDSSSDHTGITGTTNNLVSLDATGLPQDSGSSPSSFENSGAVTTHESTYTHSDLHTRDHDIDSITNHNGVSGATQNNLISFNSNGLPQDSGSSPSSFENSGAVTTHESTYTHSDLHTQTHDIDSITDHNGVSGATQDNLISFDSNGLPQDSGYKASDFGSGGGPHGLDSTSHVGISGTTDNFMSLNSDGLPQDSGFTDSDFRRKHPNIYQVGPNKDYTTIQAALTAAGLAASSSSYVTVEVDPNTYTETLTIYDYTVLIGSIGVIVEGSITYNDSNVSYINNIEVISNNTEALVKSGTGTLYVHDLDALSEWTNDDAVQGTIDINNGNLYIEHSLLKMDEQSAYATQRSACIYNVNGSNQAQVRSTACRHIVDVQAANFNISVAHDTNTNSGNRIEINDSISTLTATHATAPLNRMSLINHDASLGFTVIDNSKSYAYAPNNSSGAYFIPAHCYNGPNWNTVIIQQSKFYWADIDDSDVYRGAATHSFNALLVIDCFFNEGTDIFPPEYTTDGSAGSIFAIMSNTYGSKYIDGGGGNVAIIDAAQTITGGWTFDIASPEFKMSPIFDNDVIWLARNSSSGIENVMWPRASDDNTYFNYGSGGNFYLRNNSGTTQYSFSDTTLNINDNTIEAVNTLDFSSLTSDPTVDDGDIWYRSDDLNFRARTDSRTHEVGLVQVAQVYNNTTTDINVATPVAISWNGTTTTIRIVDSLFTHSTSTNPSRVEVNADGLFEISYSISVDNVGNSRTTPRSRIRLNGSTYITIGVGYSYTRNTTDDKLTLVTHPVLLPLTSGDYIEILCDQQGTAGTANTIPDESSFKIKLIRYT